MNEREIAVRALRQTIEKVEIYAAAYSETADKSEDRYIRGCSSGLTKAVEILEHESALIVKFGLHPQL